LFNNEAWAFADLMPNSAVFEAKAAEVGPGPLM